ncbi:MAG: (d)CMP kinase [Actinomycetales bacterium]|nr:(d)CMP kinase [Actinomycetales bacterium]
MLAPVVAVDGPAGSGKSSVCRGVASTLGLRYLDTGAMYRAMTWALLERGVDPDDAVAVAEAAPDVVIVSGTDPVDPTIHVGAVDVAGPIRGGDVTAAVSAVSAVPSVREQLVALQRAEVASAAAAGHGIVVEGRDITTVVLPDADLKVFVTADPSVRAARRAKQDAELGHPVADVQATEDALRSRDAKDSNRAASPLARAADAIVVDTTHMTLDEVIAHVCDLARGLPERT